MATVTIGFPTGVLFDVTMRGGPLPHRYEPLGGQLMHPGPLDFTPEEAIAIRNWLAQQPGGSSTCTIVEGRSEASTALFGS